MTHRVWLFLWLVGCAKAPILDPVNFQTGSTAFVNDGDGQTVEGAAEVLRTSNWSVIVLGLADAEGRADDNLRLSQERAEAVAAQLRALSEVDDSRIVVHAIGERLATGELARERKVEFVFFKDEGKPTKDVVVESGVLEADFRRKARSAEAG